MSGWRPSEAEWEYACRGGTTTARYYGQTEQLLGEYAWYSKTSGDQWMLPIGTLLPNPFGLFDMQGNVNEWCQDRALIFDTQSFMMGDLGQTGNADNSSDRVLRGGSFDYNASVVRAADRGNNRPDNRNVSDGFRVARTLNLSHLTPYTFTT